MIKHTNNNCDLRRKTSIMDPMNFHNLRIDFKDCMVIFVVLTVLLLSILAVSAAPSPEMMSWVKPRNDELGITKQMKPNPLFIKGCNHIG